MIEGRIMWVVGFFVPRFYDIPTFTHTLSTPPPTRLTHAAPYIRRVTRKKKRERDAWVDRTGYERQAARTVLTGSFTRFISFTNIPS